jgi:hypothetical protein
MIFLWKVCEFDKPIQLKTRVKLKKLEVQKLIRDEIKNTQDFRTKMKKTLNSRDHFKTWKEWNWIDF